MYNMTGKLKILILEDVPFDAEMIERELSKANFDFISRRVDTRNGFIQAIDEFMPDIVLSDHSLPQFDSMSALSIVKEKCPEVPFILITGSVSEEFAVECMKAGVDDYILKASLIRLPTAIKSIFSKKKIIRERDVIESLNNRLRRASESLKETNRDLVDSIVYAKQIQEAVLPEQNSMQKYFPNSFLIYEPKNIVSGDFYWTAEQNGKLIIAVVDCTGHGVPGAFMSMMGNNFLNTIVYVKNIIEPAEILNELNIAIRKSLKQDKIGSSSRDGMDVAICSIDLKNKVLTFAGANRPLFYLKNNALTIIKGDKFSIGGLQDAHGKVFKNHKIEMSEVDDLYMFTDGYIDQFGGSSDKKFLCKRFRQMLSLFCDRTMAEQKRLLLETFRKWKGNMEQTDDICIVGIRLA